MFKPSVNSNDARIVFASCNHLALGRGIIGNVSLHLNNLFSTERREVVAALFLLIKRALTLTIHAEQVDRLRQPVKKPLLNPKNSVLDFVPR